MIVSVYGIPRSGKDTFIEQVIKNKKNTCHVKGSATLNELAVQKYSCKFRELSATQQNEIRVDFTKYVKELNVRYETVIVDGHYAFPCEQGYASVFTQADLELYDAFFYLKRSSEEIVRNFNSGDKKDYAEHLLSQQGVDAWMDYEITNMQALVEAQDKDFIVLTSEAASVDFVCQFAKTSRQIAKDIADEISLIARGKNIVLTDLDKTVSINDLTDDFIEYAQIDPAFAKRIFKGDYYTAYQFYTFHNVLANVTNYNEAVQYALTKLVLNSNVVNDLFSLKRNGCVVALTTGMKDVWTRKNEELQAFDRIYGFDGNGKLIVTPLIKRLVAKYLASAYNVVAVGDSVIDLGMTLEATKGYLIAMTKLDQRIIAQHGKGNVNKTLLQPKYSQYKYEFSEEAEIKW